MQNTKIQNIVDYKKPYCKEYYKSENKYIQKQKCDYHNNEICQQCFEKNKPIPDPSNPFPKNNTDVNPSPNKNDTKPDLKECPIDFNETNGVIESQSNCQAFFIIDQEFQNCTTIYDYQYYYDSKIQYEHRLTLKDEYVLINKKKIKVEQTAEQISYFNYTTIDSDNGTHIHQIIVYDTYEYEGENSDINLNNFNNKYVSEEYIKLAEDSDQQYWKYNDYQSSSQMFIKVIEEEQIIANDMQMDEILDTGVQHLRRVVNYDDYIKEQEVYKPVSNFKELNQ